MQHRLILTVVGSAMLLQCTGVRPYSTRREVRRIEQRERAGDELRGEYERGLADGRAHKAAGEPLPELAYGTAAAKAYADGFTEGWRSAAGNGGRP